MATPLEGFQKSDIFFGDILSYISLCSPYFIMAEHNIHHFTQAVIPLFQNCEFCGEKIICIFCFCDFYLRSDFQFSIPVYSMPKILPQAML